MAEILSPLFLPFVRQKYLSARQKTNPGLGAFVSLRGYNAAGLAEYAHTPCVNYAKRIATNFQCRMAMLS